jgi:uncharacterized membrane protein
MRAPSINLSERERWLSSDAGQRQHCPGDRQRSLRGKLLTASGVALVARGASGHCPARAAMQSYGRTYDTREALGGKRGVHVDESITINRPASELYGIWRQLEALPTVIAGLKKVTTLDAKRSRWEASGPGGRTVQWEAEILNDIPNELIAWRTVGAPDVVSAGSVRFIATKATGETQLHVRMQYEPPGGRGTAALAWMLGKEPGQLVREGLRRFKAMLETGEVPTTVGQVHGQRSFFNYA